MIIKPTFLGKEHETKTPRIIIDDARLRAVRAQHMKDDMVVLGDFGSLMMKAARHSLRIIRFDAK
ncbi:hypothetical protein D3C87_1943290 [compost metagenome]